MAKATTTLTTPTDREIVQARTFDAPRELVWKAYTDPTLIPRWWGPRKYTTIVEKMDVRPGGVWRYIQRDDKGNEFAFNGVYREVVAPGRLVSTFEFEPMAGHVSVDTLTLEERDGKTFLEARTTFDSKEDRDGMLESGMEEGANETWERLAELVASMKS